MIAFLIAGIALLTGGLIYLLWRPDSLFIFLWADALGIGDFVQMLRSNAPSYPDLFPRWVYTSMPQALWLFSGIVLLQAVWKGDYARPRMIWTGSFVLMAFMFEFGQFLRVIPGWFDIPDTILLGVACVFGYLTTAVIQNIERRAM